MLRDFVDRPRTQTATPPRRIETIGGVYGYSWDWAPYELEEGVTVTAVTWASSSGCVTISGDDLTASVSSAYLTAVNEGEALVTLTATTDGTHKAVRQFFVRVKDPQASDYTDAWR